MEYKPTEPRMGTSHLEPGLDSSTTTLPTKKIRISHKVQSEMDGTSLGQMRPDDDPWSLDPEKAAAARSLHDKLETSSTRKDKSITVDLDEIEATILYGYMDVWLLGAQDNVSWERSYLSEIRSAKSMMQQLIDAFGHEVTRR